MANKDDKKPTVDSLAGDVRQIRDDLQDVRAELHKTNHRIDETNSRIDETNLKLDETNRQLGETHRLAEKAYRLADETNQQVAGLRADFVDFKSDVTQGFEAVTSAVLDVRNLLAERLDDRERIDDHERRLRILESKTG